MALTKYIGMADGIEDLKAAGRLNDTSYCVGLCAVAATALQDNSIEDALSVLARLPPDAIQLMGRIAADDKEAGPVLLALAERLVEAGVVTDGDEVDVGLTGAIVLSKGLMS
jgi:hypothetical protein